MQWVVLKYYMSCSWLDVACCRCRIVHNVSFLLSKMPTEPMGPSVILNLSFICPFVYVSVSPSFSDEQSHGQGKEEAADRRHEEEVRCRDAGTQVKCRLADEPAPFLSAPIHTLYGVLECIPVAINCLSLQSAACALHEKQEYLLHDVMKC